MLSRRYSLMEERTVEKQLANNSVLFHWSLIDTDARGGCR